MTTSPDPEYLPGQDAPVRGWDELRTTGVLWLLNASIFHPRGFAFSVCHDDDGEVVGWRIVGNGSERIHFGESAGDWPDGEAPDDRFLAVEELFAELRRARS